jgi:hypothetical protein
MLANIGVPLLARLEVLSLELDRILIGWDEDYLAARVARCFLIVPQPSRRPVAGYNLKSEQAFLRGELPAVAVNEVLWPAREIRHVLAGGPMAPSSGHAERELGYIRDRDKHRRRVRVDAVVPRPQAFIFLSRLRPHRVQVRNPLA